VPTVAIEPLDLGAVVGVAADVAGNLVEVAGVHAVKDDVRREAGVLHFGEASREDVLSVSDDQELDTICQCSFQVREVVNVGSICELELDAAAHDVLLKSCGGEVFPGAVGSKIHGEQECCNSKQELF
jgi:hypothetical protein